MEQASKYLERVQTFMDRSTPGEWILISAISSDPKRFIEAITFSIDLREKQYELSNDKSKVRRML